MSIRYFEVDLERVTNTVRNILEKYEYIEIAVIFGSALRRRVVRDIDIGIVSSRPLTLKELTEIASQIEEVLRVEVDIIPLDEAPPPLRFKALSEGVRVLNRNSRKYHYMLSEAFMEINDLEIALTLARQPYSYPPQGAPTGLHAQP
jgi:predicted nucleotidyltransferase